MQCVSPNRGSEPLCHPGAVIQEPEQLIITGGFLLRPSRLNLRLYESQLSSWWHKSFVVKGVISVINRDQSSLRTQPAHYTPLNSVHEQIRHNKAQLLHISSHITKGVPSSNNTHTQQWIRTEEIFTVQSDAGLWLVIAGWHLPDVEGLGWCVGQETEHQDDGVGMRKTVRVDVSGHQTKSEDMWDFTVNMTGFTCSIKDTRSAAIKGCPQSCSDVWGFFSK